MKSHEWFNNQHINIQLFERMAFIKIKIRTFVLFPLIGCLITLYSCNKNKDIGIQPYSANSYYWQYKGESVLLIGGSDDDNLFQWEKEKLEKHLALLASFGGNYIRNTMSSRDSGNLEPFLKLENGLYDLNQWNPEYWQSFRNLLEIAMNHDIIVQIELWDMHDWYIGNWEKRAFNPVNNINYTSEESKLPLKIDFGVRQANDHPFFRAHIPGENMELVRKYQEKFVEMIIRSSIEFPNVLYCINNESAIDVSWSVLWLDYIREIAGKLNRQIYVGDMLMIPSSSPVTEYGFDFADLSQSASNLYRSRDSNIGEEHFNTIAEEVSRLSVHPAPLNSVKQYGGDLIYWTRGVDEGIERVWRSVFAGQAGVRFHRPTAGQGLNEIAQANIKSLRMITDHFELKTIKPHQELSHLLISREENEAYIMGNEGKQYAIFFTASGREVELDTGNTGGRLTIRWLDILNAQWMEEQIVSGQTVILKKPGKGQWAVLIFLN